MALTICIGICRVYDGCEIGVVLKMMVVMGCAKASEKNFGTPLFFSNVKKSCPVAKWVSVLSAERQQARGKAAALPGTS